MKKINVGILFGGKSTEHEVSLQSAKNIIEAIDKEKYDITLIGIDKSGGWHLKNSSHFLLNSHDPKLIALNKEGSDVVLNPAGAKRNFLCPADDGAGGNIDVIFPILHGPLGEDGTVQGLLKLAGIPFVGADVLGSAIGMDKDVMKRLLREAGLPVADFLVFRKFEQNAIDFEKVTARLGLPVFIKPANAGSSVGVSKARDKKEFAAAIKEAFSFDNKILIEEAVTAREVECAVLGNEQPAASGVGEIITRHDFYSYQAKYIDENGAEVKIPADIPAGIVEEIRRLAIRTFQALCCDGMARVDFFLTAEGKILVNEINTIPGFTNISMYPKLWEAAGVPYSELIHRLIQLALEKHSQEKILSTSYDQLT